MAFDLSKDIRYHVWPYSILCLSFIKSDIRPQVKVIVSLVTAGGHFNLPQQFAWASMCYEGIAQKEMTKKQGWGN